MKTNKEKIEAIEKRQSNPSIHPFTCANNSKHEKLLPLELGNEAVLVCKDCGYVQKDIPEEIFNFPEIGGTLYHEQN